MDDAASDVREGSSVLARHTGECYAGGAARNRVFHGNGLQAGDARTSIRADLLECVGGYQTIDADAAAVGMQELSAMPGGANVLASWTTMARAHRRYCARCGKDFAIVIPPGERETERESFCGVCAPCRRSELRAMSDTRNAYLDLVKRGRTCGLCRELTNPAMIEAGRFDAQDHVGSWSRWEGNLSPNLVIVGQEWADQTTFCKC